MKESNKHILEAFEFQVASSRKLINAVEDAYHRRMTLDVIWKNYHNWLKQRRKRQKKKEV